MAPTNSLQGDGTSSSPHQAIIENNMEENHPSDEENVLDERAQRRLLSNRLSARKSMTKKKRSHAELIIKIQALQEESARIRKETDLYQYQEHLLKMERMPMSRELDAIEQEELARNAKDEVINSEVKRLKALRITQQEQLFDRNTAMLRHAIPNINPMPNLYSVSGNGVGPSSYMPPVPSQLWIAPVQNMQELNLTPPTNMEFMDQPNLVWGSGTAPIPPNVDK